MQFDRSGSVQALQKRFRLPDAVCDSCRRFLGRMPDVHVGGAQTIAPVAGAPPELVCENLLDMLLVGHFTVVLSRKHKGACTLLVWNNMAGQAQWSLHYAFPPSFVRLLACADAAANDRVWAAVIHPETRELIALTQFGIATSEVLFHEHWEDQLLRPLLVGVACDRALLQTQTHTHAGTREGFTTMHMHAGRRFLADNIAYGMHSIPRNSSRGGKLATTHRRDEALQLLLQKNSGLYSGTGLGVPFGPSHWVVGSPDAGFLRIVRASEAETAASEMDLDLALCVARLGPPGTHRSWAVLRDPAGAGAGAKLLLVGWTAPSRDVNVCWVQLEAGAKSTPRWSFHWSVVRGLFDNPKAASASAGGAAAAAAVPLAASADPRFGGHDGACIVAQRAVHSAAPGSASACKVKVVSRRVYWTWDRAAATPAAPAAAADIFLDDGTMRTQWNEHWVAWTAQRFAFGDEGIHQSFDACVYPRRTPSQSRT